MRTTLQIDDDVYVLSELARTALAARSEGKRELGFPVFSVSRGAGPLTSERVRAALDHER
jgi:hypothetical protein